MKKQSIPARIVKFPDVSGGRDWRKLNPKLKGFKDAKMPPVSMKEK